MECCWVHDSRRVLNSPISRGGYIYMGARGRACKQSRSCQHVSDLRTSEGGHWSLSHSRFCGNICGNGEEAAVDQRGLRDCTSGSRVEHLHRDLSLIAVVRCDCTVSQGRSTARRSELWRGDTDANPDGGSFDT
nr:hypothetical protein CFP56_13461 [Quercus suber]